VNYFDVNLDIYKGIVYEDGSDTFGFKTINGGELTSKEIIAILEQSVSIASDYSTTYSSSAPFDLFIVSRVATSLTLLAIADKESIRKIIGEETDKLKLYDILITEESNTDYVKERLDFVKPFVKLAVDKADKLNTLAYQRAFSFRGFVDDMAENLPNKIKEISDALKSINVDDFASNLLTALETAEENKDK
jgi:hypothetical protein